MGSAHRCITPAHEHMGAKRPLPPRGRWTGKAGPEEEWRDLKNRKKSEKMRYLQVSARIPLQSPPAGGASFSPGEAVCAAAQEQTDQTGEMLSSRGSEVTRGTFAPPFSDQKARLRRSFGSLCSLRTTTSSWEQKKRPIRVSSRMGRYHLAQRKGTGFCGSMISVQGAQTAMPH